MSARMSDDDRSVNLTTLTEDDRLLDQLGRGERPDGHDIDVLLADWRAALPAPDPVDDQLVAASAAAVQRPRRVARRTLVVAATALVAFGGITAAAENAGPGSLLWPITQLVYGDLAASRTAERDASEAIAAARAAVDSGDYVRATRLLADAAALTDRVDEPGVAADLLAKIAAVRALIPTPDVPQPEAVPSLPPVPSGIPPAELSPAPPTDPAAPTSAPGETAPAPTQPTGPPALLPSLPIVPPTLTIPIIPSLPLPPPLN